ncbi:MULTISPECIES: hypothetical protein [unclassified Bradyrhizobium]|uniref:hypothetical protein n=1 Tax=unclassified Bradyrhizobium TaxID=2631580 RepID=UPI0023B1331B|nr:hypothetical protein [Bradyrhizobium sp. CSS354]MDE5466316.1 hypothetical protein [Bradyrhizobium sp. CSS354]
MTIGKEQPQQQRRDHSVSTSVRADPHREPAVANPVESRPQPNGESEDQIKLGVAEYAMPKPLNYAGDKSDPDMKGGELRRTGCRSNIAQAAQISNANAHHCRCPRLPMMFDHAYWRGVRRLGMKLGPQIRTHTASPTKTASALALKACSANLLRTTYNHVSDTKGTAILLCFQNPPTTIKSNAGIG